MSCRRKSIVLLGFMGRQPFAGVVWQTVHYLVGFQRLGYEVYYVEAHAMTPSKLMRRHDDDASERAAEFLDRIMRRFDMAGRWAFHALHDDGRCYGFSESRLQHLYDSADLIINLHGGTQPREEHSRTGRLVFLETDPVRLQIELHDNLQESIDFLSAHQAFFTFGENYGNPDCRLPVSDRFYFHPTRQPVVLDFWDSKADGYDLPFFTTIGNWRQLDRDVMFNGETYYWSKHYEFVKFLDLPGRTDQVFELALSRGSCTEADQKMLEDHGWRVRDSLSFSAPGEIDCYRDYISASRGEFTVAKDQNVRFRSGWFSDRSATYLAAGRPVITQETGFSNILPTGTGLFAFTSMPDILNALESINTNYEKHSKAAHAVAQDFFAAERVLGSLLEKVGL
jgi:hypothetical protein